MHYAQYGLGIILILLLIYLLMKFGRDPKRIQTVEFEAPDGITPAEVGYIIDGIADKEDIVSLIFYWANKGYIKIDKLDDTKDSDFRLTKLRELPEEAKTYELTFFRALFPGTCSAVLLSQLDEGVAPAMMQNMSSENGYTHLEFMVPTRGLLGYRTEFINDTRGEGTMVRRFDHFEEYKGEIPQRVNGVAIAQEAGVSTPYALSNISERVKLFIEPGTDVYEGMRASESMRVDGGAELIAAAQELLGYGNVKTE